VGLLAVVSAWFVNPHRQWGQFPVLMLGAGFAWRCFISLRGERLPGDPVHTSAGNFTRAVAFAVVLKTFSLLSRLSLDVARHLRTQIISGHAHVRARIMLYGLHGNLALG